MDAPTTPITVATADRSRFGHSINFGIAKLSFGQDGLATVADEALKTQLLSENDNLFDPLNPPAPAVDPAANTDDDDDDDTTDDKVKEYLKSIKKLDKAALQQQCRELELPEAEWEKMGKTSLVAYLKEKATAEDSE
jgi:hypothetical protein